MGAFFLFRQDANPVLDEAMEVFSRKGLTTFRRFFLGSWTLVSYRKMLLRIDNFLTDTGGNSIFCCGTLSYRSLGYKASLARLLADYRCAEIDRAELIGNFCVLFWDGRTLSLMADQLNAQHVFVNESGTCLSSSFLAVLASSPRPLSLNRTAAHEKLATGYIVSPDTLVEGIRQLNQNLFPWLESKTGIRVIDNAPPDGCDGFHHQGFKNSICSQLEVLKAYFKRLESLVREFHAELGLSSGFDSRLLLALSEAFSDRIPLHSHHTVNVHEFELAIAQELASIGGNELTVFPTIRIEDQEEERRREIISENLYFFDGRCINDMGSFSETYTARYRMRVLGRNRLSLHGLGGEIYRNVYATPQRHFIWNDWADCAVFYPFAREVCRDERAFLEMRNHRNSKIAARLDVDLAGKVDFHTIRRGYGLVRMPDNAGSVSNAYNQVSFLLTPFIESINLREALKATPYIGACGGYEAAMIRELSPRLAAVNSQYGHSFSAIPPMYAMKSKIIRMVPLKLRHTRQRRRYLDIRQNSSYARYQLLRSSSSIIQEIEEILGDSFPGVDWDLTNRSDTQKCTCISVGSFIREFQHKLRT